MIEIRIPKEIKTYREKLFFGMTLRQCICTAIALSICVPLYIFGNRFLPQEAVSWAEMFRFNFSVQKRIYEYEPPFMGFRNEYIAEEKAAEINAKKHRKRK